MQIGFGIETRYRGPTESRGSRILVSRTDRQPGDPTISVDLDPAFNDDQAHQNAAMTYLERERKSRLPEHWRFAIVARCGRPGGYIFTCRSWLEEDDTNG